jgi:hypothetical protein
MSFFLIVTFRVVVPIQKKKTYHMGFIKIRKQKKGSILFTTYILHFSNKRHAKSNSSFPHPALSSQESHPQAPSPTPQAHP